MESGGCSPTLCGRRVPSEGHHARAGHFFQNVEWPVTEAIDSLRRHVPAMADMALHQLERQGLTAALLPFGEDPLAALTQSLERYMAAEPARTGGAPGRNAVLNALHHQVLLATLERHATDPAEALSIARALAEKAAERQLAALCDEAATLKAAEQRLGGTLAHELRSPLTAIAGALNLLGKYMAPPAGTPAARMVEIAVNSGSQLLKLVDALLDAERLRSGEPQLAMAGCDAGALLQQAGTMLGAAAALSDVALEVSTCSATILADADRLRQALVMLLASAIEAARPGTPVAFGATIQGDELHFRLALEGPWPDLAALAPSPASGITHAELAHMDLVLAGLLIERHGGRLWVESERAVAFSLPIAEASGGPVVLVCDEDAGFHDVIAAYLAPRGLRVLGVLNAQALIEMARVHAPAVILLNEHQATDETLAALRRPDSTTPAAPIVLMGTAGAPAPHPHADRLDKPFKKAELIAAIEGAMRAAAGGTP